MNNSSANEPDRKASQKRDKFSWNTPEFIENRGKNLDFLSKKGWVSVALKIDENDSYLQVLNQKGWLIIGQGNIWLPQLPRIDDCINLMIMNIEFLKEYGVDSNYEEFITAKVNKITMESVCTDMDFHRVQSNTSCILYYIDVSIVEIPSLSALSFE
jgi:hypothetical protein